MTDEVPKIKGVKLKNQPIMNKCRFQYVDT
jgi:hypothetical protein